MDRLAAAAGASRKRRRVCVGSTDVYEEVSGLGSGNFGAVVKARHRVTGQTVAIKRLTLSDADGGLAEDPLQEAALHEACVGHPSIVGFHGVVRDPSTSRICLVMECVDGPSLHDYLHHHRPRRRGAPSLLPEATVRAAMWQLLGAAKKMHESRVIHRDIKPENILMLLEIPDYGAAVDAWSLGCVMAEIIASGTPLFGKGGGDDDGQLVAIFDLLGMPDEETWPGFSSTPFATKVVPELKVNRRNRLREIFPKAMLSEEGFEVLDGLLTCNPGKRLTAEDALKKPWFVKVDALELPRKDEVASSALPSWKKKLLVAPAAAGKRRKLQCV
nr:unnamed protein product [Digitaria exilis]